MVYVHYLPGINYFNYFITFSHCFLLDWLKLNLVLLLDQLRLSSGDERWCSCD